MVPFQFKLILNLIVWKFIYFPIVSHFSILQKKFISTRQSLNESSSRKIWKSDVETIWSCLEKLRRNSWRWQGLKKEKRDPSCTAFTWHAMTRTNWQDGRNRGGQVSCFVEAAREHVRSLVRDKATREQDLPHHVPSYFIGFSLFNYATCHGSTVRRRRRRRLATKREFYRAPLPPGR